MEKNFWNDVASKSAILGATMLLSHIFEQMMLLNGNIIRMGIMGIEMTVILVVYIYLLYRFTKKYSLTQSEEDGFTYNKALSYVISLSLFASIIVGLGNYIFTHFIIGYEEYIAGVTNLYTNILSSVQIPAQMVGTYEQMLEQIGSQPEPSIFATISSAIWNYVLLGLLAGLIIAAKVKREPNIFGDNNE